MKILFVGCHCFSSEESWNGPLLPLLGAVARGFSRRHLEGEIVLNFNCDVSQAKACDIVVVGKCTEYNFPAEIPNFHPHRLLIVEGVRGGCAGPYRDKDIEKWRSLLDAMIEDISGKRPE